MAPSTLVVQPYVGELGWECFSWQPLIRGIFLARNYARCVVYAKGGGRSKLYRFAEVRDFPDEIPGHEAECLLWHDFAPHREEMNAIIRRTAELAKAEFGDDAETFSYPQLDRFNHPYFERGQPDLLYGEGGKYEFLGLRPIVICVRDRGMSDYRNSDPETWVAVAEHLAGSGLLPIIVGRVRKPEEGGPDPWAELPPRCRNLLNATTIDDLIDLFWEVGRAGGLAVGGSTGTLHLASRCACPHLVYGNRGNVERYAATNWFGAAHRVVDCGWEPPVERVVADVNDYLEGRFA